MRNNEQLSWQSEDLLVLTKGVANSVYDSLKYLGSEYPVAHLNLKPSFVTQNVIDACKGRFADREANYNGDEPKLSVDIMQGNKVQIALFGIYEGKNFVEIDRWNLNGVEDHQKTIEGFFDFVAENCFKMVKVNRGKFGGDSSLRLDCGLIFRLPVDQLSLTDSMLNEWSLKLDAKSCESKDLASLFNDSLKKYDGSSSCSINCSHVVNDCVSALAGMQIRDKMADIMVTMNQSQNICFFYSQHQIKGYECQNMIINSEVFNMGHFIGSNDQQLLSRFISPIEDVLKTANKNDKNLLPKLTDGYHICEAIRKFIVMDFPEQVHKFAWLKCPGSISEADISNFLEFIDDGNSKPTKLTPVYLDILKHKRHELSNMCKVLVERSASLMAAVTLGFVRAMCYANKPTKKICVGLDGSLMLTMYGYKKQFIDTIKEIQSTAAKSMHFEPALVEIDFIELGAGDAELNNVLLSEHIANNLW